ncbi:MAG: hypothetical protein PHS42_02325 [Sulfurimonas sp.]|nr:hypothetical protein [Sulfurimonas sp.]MDD3834287.1 hypothetical protein [Sulfurimonas sp.]
MNLDKFLQLFNPYPGNRYLQISTQEDEITKELKILLDAVDGKLNLALFNEQNLNFSQLFRASPRDHDKVIIQDVLSRHENPKMILKLAYQTLANSANIIILEKKGTTDIASTKILLEELEFRSANEIDILKDYDLIMAKKMHMWGNGL